MQVENNNRHCEDGEYNCFTFAFNIPNGEWLDPFMEDSSDEFISNCIDEGMRIDDIEEILLENAGYFFEENYDIKWLINAEDILNIDYTTEEVIQFRVGVHHGDSFHHFFCGPESDNNLNHFFDFHFKVFRNNKWQEKNGCGEVHDCNPWSSLFFGIYPEDAKYTSRTITFTHKIIKN